MSETGEMRTDQVNRAYGQALFEMADEASRLDEIADEMDQLGELLRHEPGLWKLMESRALSVRERADSIQRLFEGRVSDVLYRFLQVLNRKHRLDKLKGIIQAFSDMVSEHRGLVEVDVFVPQRLAPADAEQISGRVGQILNREIVLHQYVDPTLIGGLKLRVGDRMIDGSVSSQLKRLRRELGRQGHARARQGGELGE